MAGFEKIKLATGEFRADYIARRLAEKASAKDIAAEINSPGLYSGEPGHAWPVGVVYAATKKASASRKPRPARAAAIEDDKTPGDEPEDAGADLDPQALLVPPEYEGVLNHEDMAEIRAEAAATLRKKQRKQARQEMLALATAELEREAKIARKTGALRGDTEEVVIDLAPYAGDIKLDGESFQHGSVVRVPRNVAAVLREQIQRSWQHEGSLHGNEERPYRRTLGQRGLTANNFKPGLRA